MKNHYLAFTIGPLLHTITRARKTRELWAASYVFSLLMRKLLEELKDFDILLPHTVFDEQGKLPSAHLGAGIWPDRCFVRIGDKTPDVETIINNACEALAKELDTTEKLRTFIKVYPLKANWEGTSINEGAISGDANDLIPIHRLNRLLDNLELATPYQPEEKSNLNQLLAHKDQIRALYATAKHTASRVFIQLSDGTIRLPSLPELALCEIKKHSDDRIADIYSNTVEVPFNKEIIKIRQQEGRPKDLFSDQKKEQIYIDLKDALPKGTIAFRHKYIAVVVADGDNLGAAITEISKDDADGEKLKAFSKKLMNFSREAVKKVADYGGLPIYVGGDDLLFLAPVTNENADCKHVFELCDKLNDDFKEKMDSTTSLSFGVSINYYKHPLGEAVSEAFKLEKKAKTFKICHKEDTASGENHAKQALCFQVRKHSGQQYGASLWMSNESKSKELFMKMLEKNVDDVFLTSIMHKFQSIPSLLANAARNKNIKHFQKNHFNEGGKHDAPFLKNAMDLAEAVFDEYGDVLDEKTEKAIKKDPQFKKRLLDPIDFHHTNILFAVLRLKQFLIQKDHD